MHRCRQHSVDTHSFIFRNDLVDNVTGEGIFLAAVFEISLCGLFHSIKKIWEPRGLTTLWDFTACYRGRFNFYLFLPGTYAIKHGGIKEMKHVI
jgi:hypothetical protein